MGNVIDPNEKFGGIHAHSMKFILGSPPEKIDWAAASLFAKTTFFTEKW